MAGIPGQPSGQSSPSPIPGQAQNDSFAAFQAAQKPTSDSFAAFAAQQAGTQPSADQTLDQPSFTDQAKALGGQALDISGRVLDYPGGFTRAGITAGASALTGQNVVTAADLKAAAKGEGPGFGEYLKRMGVSEGGSLSFGGNRVTLRGAEGFALDVLTDPLTVISKAVKEIPYLQKLINAPGAASEALGEAVYKSAVAPAEAKLAAKGKIAAGETPIGNALLENGAPVGNAATLEQKVADISSTMGKVRQGLYDKATELGVKIDTAYPLKRAEGVLVDMRQHPPLQAAADELQNMMDSYKQAGNVSLDMMSKWKSQLYDSLPKSAFGQYGKLNSFGKQFKAALAQDFRQAIVGAGNAAEKGLGDAIEGLNSKWGALLDATNSGAMAEKSSGSLGKQLDGIVLAAGGLKAAAIKKTYDLATSPHARTAVGKALMQAGQNDLANRLVRQSLAPKTGPPEELQP